MKLNNLLILDLDQNLEIERKGCNYINLSFGNIKLQNSEKILLKKYYSKYYNYFKKKLIKKFIKVINGEKNKNFLSELEIFNLRNDKEKFFNKIINILIIKNIIIKKAFYNIELITDNPYTLDVFKKLKKNIKISYYGSKGKPYHFTTLKIFKFYLKSLMVLILLRLIKASNVKNNYKNSYISLFPNFYKNNREIFFNNNSLKINFLLTDETHLGHGLLDIIKILKNFRDKNTIHIESFIYMIDLLKLLKNITLVCSTILKNFNKNFIVNECNFSEFFNYYLNRSIVNRLKLEIYNEASARLFKKFSNIKNFHYYMFEHSFGFYISRLIRSKFKKINLVGYQHGIYSNNLMWFDIIGSLKKKKYFFPNKIISLNKLSENDYREKLGSKINILTKNTKKISSLVYNCKIKNKVKSLDKILILAGGHDVSDIYHLINNNQNDNRTDKIYYFKIHPKIKFNFIESKNLKKINQINNINFTNVFISQRSTLVYDFLKSRKNFKIVSIDYQSDLVSSKFNKKYQVKI